MPALSRRCKEELSRDSPSYQQIEGRQRELAACDAPLAANGKRRKGGHAARLPLAETCEAASASTEGLEVGKKNLAIAKEIRAAITSLAKHVKTMKQYQEKANTVAGQMSRQPKITTMQPPTPDTA